MDFGESISLDNSSHTFGGFSVKLSPGEGMDYPLQHSCASLVAQMVKTLPAMQETWVQSLCWRNPLEKGMLNQASSLA